MSPNANQIRFHCLKQDMYLELHHIICISLSDAKSELIRHDEHEARVSNWLALLMYFKHVFKCICCSVGSFRGQRASKNSPHSVGGACGSNRYRRD